MSTNRNFDYIFKAVIVALATAVLSGIGYLTLVVIKKPDLETKFEKQDELIKDVKIALLTKWGNTTTETKKLAKEIKLLKEKLEVKTAEVQRLEELLTPFRSIALERFSGDEKEALMKLAERIKTLEQHVSKYVFKPLSPDIRTQVIKQLTGLQKIYKDNNLHIELTHETWTPPNTRKYANQLAAILAESELNVTGPGFATVVHPDNQSFPLEWGYNNGQKELVNKLFMILNAVQSCKNFAARKDLSLGRIRIHMAGDVIFDDQGRVLFE
ncbi:MAG: hypothetical protein SCARUB_00498 [Candidatus Scalindua rubra]|uniref:Uncharacterized protein n=1 Tax=Candidatus Scalindua rubra TaxID=1872076 RepID=A0A1E3XFF7_9BACT|nr:MAG: hypothetical protein SCARUB_00498 [Candidatus Scalindua rubra]